MNTDEHSGNSSPGLLGSPQLELSQEWGGGYGERGKIKMNVHNTTRKVRDEASMYHHVLYKCKVVCLFVCLHT